MPAFHIGIGLKFDDSTRDPLGYVLNSFFLEM